MHIETITHEGKKLAILPVKALKKLLADAEMLADIQAYDAAKTRLAKDEDEIIPFAVIERRLSGESPVKIWREHRKMTQTSLAVVSGVSRVMIAAIEAGHKKGAAATLKKIARALEINLEQLV